jgi:hypothetical protein
VNVTPSCAAAVGVRKLDGSISVRKIDLLSAVETVKTKLRSIYEYIYFDYGFGWV